MSLSATYCKIAPQQRAETKILLLIVWSATVVSYLLASLGGGETLSTDDAMRLVEVRDVLAGQGWFDPTQYRLSPPEGVPTHWSRLIDLPIAALVRAGELALPGSTAERVATIVWPAGLLLVFLAGVARLARELAGDAAARLALIFAAVMGPVLQHFRPGAIDHHNAQLVLLVWTLALAARACSRDAMQAASTQPRSRGLRKLDRDATMAGGLCALSLAIGLEMAPAIVALAGAVTLQWIVRGEAAASVTAGFALALAASAVAFFAATVPPARYGVAACDMLSIVHVVAAGIGGIGLAALTAARGLTTTGRRLAGAAALGALLTSVLAFTFPACLGDPYGDLDPRMASLWLANVSEARSFLTLLRDLPQEVLPYYGLLAAGLALGLWRCWREPAERWGWINGIAVLAALSIVALWQVRGTAAANAVAVALVAAALVRALPAPPERAVFFGLGRAVLIAACVINPLALIALGNAGARAVELTTGTRPPLVIADGPGTCRRAADYAPLAKLPRGLVLGFIDAGPFLLLETPHAVLAAPYHRNVTGNAAMLDVYLGGASEAAARLAALGVDYVAFCPGAPERYNYARAAPDGLAAILARGEVPNFLERIDLDGTDLAVYRPRR
jgi:hypothetical protein